MQPSGGTKGAPTVGLFDSGIGGLSVLRRMLDVPEPSWAEVLYFADLAHFPYGPRPSDEVRRFAFAGVDLLARMGADVIVVACNTAASAGLRAGREPSLPPLVDIIGPGARHANAIARETRAGRVIVLGTEGTVRSRVWEQALREAGYAGTFTGWPCPYLAKLIEEGRNGSVVRQAVFEATQGLRLESWAGGAGAAPSATVRKAWPRGARPHDVRPSQVVVLGCTHYPFAKSAFEEVLAGQVLEGCAIRVVDPAEALVAELVRLLEKGLPDRDHEGAPGREGMARPSGERLVEVRFLTTGRAAHLRERAAQLLADKLTAGANRLRLDEVREVGLTGAPA